MSSVLSGLQRGVASALPGCDYHDLANFEVERRRIFHRKWFCAGRASRPVCGFTLLRQCMMRIAHDSQEVVAVGCLTLRHCRRPCSLWVYVPKHGHRAQVLVIAVY